MSFAENYPGLIPTLVGIAGVLVFGCIGIMWRVAYTRLVKYLVVHHRRFIERFIIWQWPFAGAATMLVFAAMLYNWDSLHVEGALIIAAGFVVCTTIGVYCVVKDVKLNLLETKQEK